MDKSETLEKLKAIFTKKNANVLIALGFVGILLLTIPSFFNSNQSQAPPKATEIAALKTDDVQDKYRQNMRDLIERTVEEILNEKVTAMLTLECSSESVYAYEERRNTNVSTDSQSSGGRDENREDVERNIVVTRNKNGDETPVLVKTLEPKLQGVVIVSKAEISADSEINILSAVKAITGLSANRISIIGK